MEAAVKIIYESCGLVFPDHIEWAESPKGAVKILQEIYSDPNQEWNKILFNIGYGQHDVSWIAFYDTLVKAGVVLEDKHQKWLEATITLTETGWWFPYKEMVVMTERPSEIHVDNQSQLHNLNGPAVAYSDGWKFYFVHGVKVEEWMIKHPEDITVSEILKENNNEVRRIMCELMGWEKFVENGNFKLLNEADDPGNPGNKLKLYQVPRKFVGSEMNLLICVNTTPKRDGTIPKYGITVPVSINDAVAAAAWTFDVSRDDYLQLMRTT